MSLVDDARAIWDQGPYEIDQGGLWCQFCAEMPTSAHKSDCPWLSMPGIVAALEAASAVAADPAPTYWEWEQGEIMPPGYGGGSVLKCARCRMKIDRHADDCPWAIFKAALHIEVQAR